MIRMEGFSRGHPTETIVPEHRFGHYQTKAEWERAVLLNAAYFTVVLALGGGQRKRREFTRLSSAINAARNWRDPYGRQAIVYAVTATGRSTPIDRAEWGEALKLWRNR